MRLFGRSRDSGGRLKRLAYGIGTRATRSGLAGDAAMQCGGAAEELKLELEPRRLRSRAVCWWSDALIKIWCEVTVVGGRWSAVGEHGASLPAKSRPSTTHASQHLKGSAGPAHILEGGHANNSSPALPGPTTSPINLHSLTVHSIDAPTVFSPARSILLLPTRQQSKHSRFFLPLRTVCRHKP